MLSTFGTLNTALRTLHTMQQSIQISSHNVSNAATPGYSRQKTILTTGSPYSVPNSNRYVSLGQVGTGVMSNGIQRYRSSFLDSQIRNESTMFKGWETRQDVLQQVQVALNEPSETGINAHLNSFWASWHNLATNPDSVSTRSAVVETAVDLSTTLRDTYRQLETYQSELNNRVAVQVGQINNMASRIADLNATIRDVQALNQQPNDLRDERDKLITELSEMINIDAHETESGTAMISVGGKLLVMDHIASPMAVEQDPANNMMNRIVWANTGAVVQVRGVPLEGGLSAVAMDRLGGELGGTLLARDRIVPQKMSQLDDMANALITQVNALHQTGFALDGSTNRPFFDPTKLGARNIAVSDALTADHSRVATAAATGSPGDGAVALAIARLEKSAVLNSGTATINDYFRGVITSLGQEAQQANVMTNNQGLLVDHLKTRQEEISGVSLDEETVYLLQYQRTYQAAARVMTTVDEMLDKIINGMGLVGR
jgi:flagellar hook-associated protein 1 FlgK